MASDAISSIAIKKSAGYREWARVQPARRARSAVEIQAVLRGDKSDAAFALVATVLVAQTQNAQIAFAAVDFDILSVTHQQAPHLVHAATPKAQAY